MFFEDMKKFYMAIGFLNEFSNRGYKICYPEDDLYVTNHLNYLKSLADKYNVVYCFDKDSTDDEKVELLEDVLDDYFTNFH